MGVERPHRPGSGLVSKLLPPLQPRSLILELFGLQGLVEELEESGAGRYLMSFTGTWPVGACMQEVCSICVFPSGSCHPFKRSLPPPHLPQKLSERRLGRWEGKRKDVASKRWYLQPHHR